VRLDILKLSGIAVAVRALVSRWRAGLETLQLCGALLKIEAKCLILRFKTFLLKLQFRKLSVENRKLLLSQSDSLLKNSVHGDALKSGGDDVRETHKLQLAPLCQISTALFVNRPYGRILSLGACHELSIQENVEMMLSKGASYSCLVSDEERNDRQALRAHESKSVYRNSGCGRRNVCTK